MTKKNKLFGMLTLSLSFVLAGCTMLQVGARYSPPPPPLFNEENVAKGAFFFINSVYTSERNNIEGLCFIVNLGTFDTERGSMASYELIFPELGTGPAGRRGITLHMRTSDVQARDISILPSGRHSFNLLRDGEPSSTITTYRRSTDVDVDEFTADQLYFLYQVDTDNVPRFFMLSGEGSVQWAGQEFPKSAIIDGVNAAVALEFDWRMRVAESVPAPDTLERRTRSDREGSAIARFISRDGNLNRDMWYMFTNDERPGETFYAYYDRRFFFWDVFRKIN